MNAKLLAIGAGLGLGLACGTADTAPRFEVYPPSQALAPAAWSDTTTSWRTVSILNETYYTLDISQLDVSGEAAPFIEVEVLDSDSAFERRRAITVRLRVDPSADRRTWSTNTFDALLRMRVGGSGEIDPNTGRIDETKREEVDVEVPLTVTLNCDLDRDGYDADACGGRDCDDTLILVNPEAIDYCDGYDNDCKGVPDGTECVDLDED